MLLAAGAVALIGYFLATLRSLDIYLPSSIVVQQLSSELADYHLLLEEILMDRRHAEDSHHPGHHHAEDGLHIAIEPGAHEDHGTHLGHDHHGRQPDAVLDTVESGLKTLLDGGVFQDLTLVEIKDPEIREIVERARWLVAALDASADQRLAETEYVDHGSMADHRFHDLFIRARQSLHAVEQDLLRNRQDDREALTAILTALVWLFGAIILYVGFILRARRRDERRFVAELKREVLLKQRAAIAADQAAKAKSSFLAIMSHELRTPLNAILGFCEMMQAGYHGVVENPRHAEYLGHIHQSGTRLLDLISMVLDYSKAEAGQLVLREEEVGIATLINRAIDELAPFARSKSIRLLFEPQRNLPMLVCDPRLIASILSNALSNAVKYTHDGGRVVLRAAAPGAGLTVTVKDDGVGMSPDDLAVALTPFGQVDNPLSRRHPGTGLGLPFIQAIMRQHGGSLVVNSRRGVGTEVALMFPGHRVRCRAVVQSDALEAADTAPAH